MKKLELKVNPQFKPIFNIDSKYLILVGDHSTGKFYAACQKAVLLAMLKKESSITVFCDYPKVALSIFKEILCDTEIKVNKSTRTIAFNNGSTVLIEMAKFIDSFYGSRADMVIVQSANYIDNDSFQKINNTIRNGGQMIITTNKICPLHWLGDVSEDIESSIINVGDDQFTTIRTN